MEAAEKCRCELHLLLTSGELLHIVRHNLQKTGGLFVIKKMGRYILIVSAFLFVFGAITGCGTKEEKTQTAKPVIAPSPAEMEAKTQAPPADVKGESPVKQVTDDTAGTAVEVDGVKMTKSHLDAEVKKRMAMLKDQIPADKIEQARAEIRKGLVDDFVLRTLMVKEVADKKVTATEKEIAEVMAAMKAQLPPGMTMDEFIKKNQIDAAKIREEIGMNIKINKLVDKGLGGKLKVADKEIAEFYEKNIDKFKKPESVHARHILIARTPEDKEKALADKKAKAEDLRKKLLGGADFADLAAKNSDCPSKQAGGDLGTFSRGQMVKPFEDAAFSQEKNAIGPVVETDFGFHIIQVLDHQASQTVKLDADMKKRISSFIEEQKHQTAFDEMVKRLRAAANIVVYGK
jgi:peptidyl-prolyl cis-trans isomerase C